MEGRKPLEAKGRPKDGLDVGPTGFSTPTGALLFQRLDSRLVFANGAQLRKGENGGDDGENIYIIITY